MMSFTMAEILLSILYALIFGVGFSLFAVLMLIVREIVLVFGRMMEMAVDFEKLLPLPTVKNMKINQAPGRLITVLWVIFFSLGFCLLSYLSLDGEIRLYMLILAFASFYLSKFVFFNIFSRLFVFLFGLLFSFLSIILRVIILLLRKTKRSFIK